MHDFTCGSGDPLTFPIALSGGDPAGIGPDIALDAWLARNERSLPPFAIYSDADALMRRAELRKLNVPIEPIRSLDEARNAFQRALPVVEVPCPAPVHAGQPDPRNGRAVIAAIELATAAVMSGEASALVTNPIAKSVLYEAGFRHPGHTEFLAALAEQAQPGRRYLPVMMLAAEELRVVPLTIHVALSAVPGLLTSGLIEETARILHAALARDFGCTSPRIAVAGLNPHAGENGTMGTEDRDIIAPAIARLRADGLEVSGPFSADTLFHAAARARYDAALCMYHDQALIPIKTLAFDRGVNITLGLPFVRVSPDHGTAFDIAGTGKASPTSLIEALLTARRMSLCRYAAAHRQ